MKEIFIKGASLPETYHLAIKQLKENGIEYSCKDWNTKQKEISITFEITEPLKEPMISKLFIGDPKSLEKYRQELIDGILDFEVELGNWTYTYHKRMEEQIPFIIDELRRNSDSRRAIISIRDWKVDAQTDSPACLQSIQYFIRNKALYCKTLFRSNDACKASFMNIFALIMLQKKIAGELGVTMGSYTHRANSYHCYEKDYDMLNGYVNRINSSELKDLCYFYVGDWQDMMIEYQDEIEKEVKELKNRLHIERKIKINDAYQCNTNLKVVDFFHYLGIIPKKGYGYNSSRILINKEDSDIIFNKILKNNYSFYNNINSFINNNCKIDWISNSPKVDNKVPKGEIWVLKNWEEYK